MLQSNGTALAFGTSVMEMTADELDMVGGGVQTVVMVCKVENYEVTSCTSTTKED